MAGLIQRAVNALYVKDTDTSRVRDNIVAALNPVLIFLTNNFAQDNPVTTFLRGVMGSTAIFTGNVTSQSVNTGPIVSTSVNTGPIVSTSETTGPLTSTSVTTGPLTATTTNLGDTTTNLLTTKSNLVVNGNSLFNGKAAINGDVSIGGNFYIVSRTGNGFVIQPATTDGPAFYVTNMAGTAAVFLVDGSGNGYGQAWQFTTVNCTTLTCNSIVDAAGIPCTIDCGTMWNSGAAASTFYQTMKGCMNAAALGGAGGTPFIFKFPRSGSIMGYSVNQAGPVSGPFFVQYRKNNTVINQIMVGPGSNNSTFWGTHNKGSYPFLAGDTLTVWASSQVQGNVQLSIILTLELSA